MCYPKPGPRCSAHARTAYIRISTALRDFNFDDQSSDEYVRLRDEEGRAEFQFYMTPWGQKELQRKIDAGEDDYGVMAINKERAWEARRQALAALKQKDIGDHDAHDLPVLTVEETHFASSDEERRGWENNPEIRTLMSNYIDSAEVWQSSLSDEERESVRYWTAQGCREVGDYLYKGTITKESSARIRNGIKHLDTALEKCRSDTPVVVYRGLNHWALPSKSDSTGYGNDRLSDAEVQQYVDKTYVVGQTITVPSYQSATADPGKAMGFSGTDVVLEIKTRRSGSVGTMSSWETVERERLLPRNMKFRVVDVQRSVPYINYSKFSKKDRADEMTVIQLEEIED